MHLDAVRADEHLLPSLLRYFNAIDSANVFVEIVALPINAVEEVPQRTRWLRFASGNLARRT